jgi:hypothetical protein
MMMIVFALICGAAGAAIAQHKNLKTGQWAVACALLPIVGVALLLMAPARPNVAR